MRFTAGASGFFRPLEFQLFRLCHYRLSVGVWRKRPPEDGVHELCQDHR
jgi:hypothetical protein